MRYAIEKYREETFIPHPRPPAGTIKYDHMPGTAFVNLDFLKSVSLKTKMALAASVLFLLFVVTASYLTLTYFERKFKESISAQQSTLIASLARNIDDKLNIAHNALIAVSATAPPDAMVNPEAAQRFLDSNAGLLSIFDNGIFFIDKHGKLVVESPYRPDRRGKDLSFREWVQKTVARQKPYISDPYISTHSPGQPAVVLTAPIFDRHGAMTGMMTGSLDLTKPNLLGQLSNFKIGTAGYIFLIDNNGILIVHADKARIMKPVAPPGVNRIVDRAMKGFEGSGETVTSYGIPMLTSIKRLPSTSWILGANYPLSEAYEPLNRAKRYFGLATVAGTTLLLIITWLIMRRLMSPLMNVITQVRQLPEKSGADRLISIESRDEIGVLAGAFNALLVTLESQQQSLHEQTVQLEQEVAERQMAQEKLALQHHQLELLNDSLEERISQSVTELRRKDRLLIQQSRQAAMGDMIHNIAHQWRQPLNNLGLIVQNLESSFISGTLSRSEMETEVGLAMDTIMFMSRTIDDFRNFFRTDKHIQTFSVNELVAKTADIVAASLKHNHITLEIQNSAQLTAEGYPNEFSQVVLNIINNARDVLTERQIPEPRIQVQVHDHLGRAVITIGDNGGGIDDTIVEKIFDPYFSTKHGGKASGIGLYMSKVIIEQNMHGSLSACNRNDGAEFRIEIAAAAA